MREYTIKVHEIAVDGMPPNGLYGRLAFIFDGCIVSGWPLDAGGWEANSDVGLGGEFYGVTHWVEFPEPLWNIAPHKLPPHQPNATDAGEKGAG